MEHVFLIRTSRAKKKIAVYVNDIPSFLIGYFFAKRKFISEKHFVSLFKNTLFSFSTGRVIYNLLSSDQSFSQSMQLLCYRSVQNTAVA